MIEKWREILKENETLLGNKNTYKKGVENLILLRNEILQSLRAELCDFNNDEFSKMPFVNKIRYDNKSIAYYIYENYRKEDFLINEIIKCESQIIFKENFIEKLKASLSKDKLTNEEIEVFSLNVDIKELWNYAYLVNESVNECLSKITFADIIKKFTVNINESSPNYLVNYSRFNRWSHETFYGFLIRDFSYSLILNYEACMNIKEEIMR